MSKDLEAVRSEFKFPGVQNPGIYSLCVQVFASSVQSLVFLVCLF